MTRGLHLDADGTARIATVPDQGIQEGQVRIAVDLASPKHGTLFTLLSGESPFEGRRFDLDQRLFVADDGAQPAAAAGFIGNMVVGRVIERGAAVSTWTLGDRVYGYGPVCDNVVLREAGAARLDGAMSARDALCLDPALMAFAALRDGRIGLGDDVVLFGLGAIGLMAAQLLVLAGCRRIVVVDPVARRRDLALDLGAHVALDPTGGDVARALREELGRGADIAIEASGAYAALRDALRAVRQCGRVVTLGYYHGPSGRLDLGAEFFHNRLELVASLPAWQNPSREHPLWDNGRMWDTLGTLMREGRLSGERIVDPVVDLADAPAAIAAVRRDPAAAVKLGIRFPGEDAA